MDTTTFNYSLRHVNHRIVSGGIVALAGIAILLLVAGISLPFQMLLALGIVVVVFHAARFYALKSGDGVAVRVGPEGLQVAEWGVGAVPWSEIRSVRISGRTTVVVDFQDAGRWLSRLKPVERALRRVASFAGSGPFTIDAGLLAGQPVQLEMAIQKWLVSSNS